MMLNLNPRPKKKEWFAWYPVITQEKFLLWLEEVHVQYLDVKRLETNFISMQYTRDFTICKYYTK